MATASNKALIDEACDHIADSFKGTAATGDAPPDMQGFIDTLLPILLPILLQLFQGCQKGPAKKKATQIDDEYRRLSLVRRGRLKERKLHKFAQKAFDDESVTEAAGRELTDAEKDALYERAAEYAFENRDAVAKAAASK